jgi:hypothetical protein
MCRFGWEAGQLLRLLHDKNISWGTYVDEMGTHCNAHSNNLVLLPEKAHETQLLAPLDLDMAFTANSCIEEDDAVRQQWMHLEQNGFAMALAGDEQLSTGVTGTIDLEPNVLDVKWAMRDTLMRGYYAALAGEDDLHPFPAAQRSIAYSLLRLALIITMSSIA